MNYWKRKQLVGKLLMFKLGEFSVLKLHPRNVIRIVKVKLRNNNDVIKNGQVQWVSNHIKTGVFDAEYEDVVTRASRAVIGYREPFKKEILSLCEAISRHLVVERNGVRLLEAQVATGGIIDMKSPLRLSIEAASRKGLLESRLAKQLQVRTKILIGRFIT